jgi:hypothetical protein
MALSDSRSTRNRSAVWMNTRHRIVRVVREGVVPLSKLAQPGARCNGNESANDLGDLFTIRATVPE